MKISVPDKFRHLLKPKRFKVFYGGRGGAKTVSGCKIILAIGMSQKKKILGLREYMNSIEDSIHSTLADEVSGLGLEGFYKVGNNKITAPNGTLIRYAGLARNLSSIKSKNAFDIALVEEASAVSQKSLDVLIPTIRATGSELWFFFNPDSEEDAVYQEFVVPNKDALDEFGIYEDEFLIVVNVSLWDNPFAPQELLDDSARLKEKNYKKWLHVYGGECGGNFDDPIFEVDKFQLYDILPPDFEYMSVFGDTALTDKESSDYTVFQCWAKYQGRIYLVAQYRKKIKASKLKTAFIEFWNEQKARCSTAQPLRAAYIEDKASGIQLVQDIQEQGGIPIISVPRPPGSGKVFRANNFSPWINSGLLCLPRNAVYLYSYKNEFDQFTTDDTHPFDDQIDPTLDAIAYMLAAGQELKIDDADRSQSKPIAPGKNAKIW